MKRHTFSLAILAISALALCLSCATSLGMVKITRLDLSLRQYETGIDVDSVIPGKVYSVNIVVYDDKDVEVPRPDLSGISLTSPNRSFSSFKLTPNNQLLAAASPESFRLLDSQFNFILEVKGNAYPKQEYSWPVNWGNYVVFDFTGEDGMDGKDGYTPLNLEGAADCCIGIMSIFTSSKSSKQEEKKTPVKGSNGGMGLPGMPGTDGGSAVLDLAYYLHNGELGIIAFERNSRRLFFMPLHPFWIDASGGDGVGGGDGGDGESPPDPDFGGNGGDAGDGGHGGDGGNITVSTLASSDIMSLCTLKADGGKPGRTGTPGEGGNAGVWGREGGYGKPGENGLPGAPGQTSALTVKKESELFAGVTDQNFKRENLRWTAPRKAPAPAPIPGPALKDSYVPPSSKDR